MSFRIEKMTLAEFRQVRAAACRTRVERTSYKKEAAATAFFTHRGKMFGEVAMLSLGMQVGLLDLLLLDLVLGLEVISSDQVVSRIRQEEAQHLPLRLGKMSSASPLS